MSRKIGIINFVAFEIFGFAIFGIWFYILHEYTVHHLTLQGIDNVKRATQTFQAVD